MKFKEMMISEIVIFLTEKRNELKELVDTRLIGLIEYNDFNNTLNFFWKEVFE